MSGALITGCPRSGTSVVAALFEAHGAHGGEMGEFPLGGNPNFEHVYFHAINDMLLGADGGSWTFPPEFVTGSADPTQAGALVAQFEGRVGFLKAPQLCLTYPVWRPWFPDWQVVCLVRHPMAVARSIYNMTMLAPPRGLTIWKRSMHAVLAWEAAYGLTVRYVEYPSLTGLAAALASVGLQYDADVAQRVMAPDKTHFAPEELPDWGEPFERLYKHLCRRAAS